jgi:anhydro-N-acetylmuramic acid kinase
MPPGALPEDVRGWDTGPANILLDAFVLARSAGPKRFDVDGRHALRASRRVDGRARADARGSYFTLSPPKSTGRERFGASFLYAPSRRC